MHRQQGGFTIVESMIVLAVTGSMFLMAVLFVTGKQADEQFRQAVRDFETKITDAANDVATGTYTKANGCTSSGGALNFSGPVTGQGTAEQCIYLGKALRFQDSGFESYSVLGSRLDGAELSATFNNALPTINPNENEVYTIPWGITIDTPGVGVSPHLKIGVRSSDLIGIYNCFGNDTACSGDVLVGEQISRGGGIKANYYQGVVQNTSQAETRVSSSRRNAPNGGNGDRNIMQDSDVIEVCLTDGDRRALVRISSSSGNVTALSTIGRSAC